MLNTATIMYRYWRIKYALKFGSREELLRWQDAQVRHFLNKILPRSLYYKDLFSGLDIREWAAFPVTSKAQLAANFDRLNTVGISAGQAFDLAFKAEQDRNFSPMIGDITVGLSSGTSGGRALFLVSRQERCSWAGAVLAKVLPRSIFARHAIAFFLRANSNLYQTVRGRNISFDFFDLLAAMEPHIARLNRLQPSILIAPPSALRLLAQARQEGRLKIHPEKIVSVAEVLDPLYETFISECFGQPVHQVYQATEGFLAFTCPHGTMHLNEDTLVVQKEYLDRDLRKFVPVITDFSRTSQPIIRYRLNDILTEKDGACPCGSVFTAISKVEGRCDDVFYLPALSSGKVTVFPDFLSRAVICADQAIVEYKVTQTTPEEIEIFFRLKDADHTRQAEVQEVIRRALVDLFIRLGSVVPQISFTKQLSVIPGKKLKRVESLVTV